MNKMKVDDGARACIGRLDRRSALKLLGAGGAVTLGGHSVLGRGAAATEHAVAPGTGSGTLNDKIADYIIRARFEDIPPAVIRKAKEQLVYYFGRAFEVALLEPGQQMRRVAQQIARPQGGVSVVGHRMRLAPADAAFANSSLMGASLGKDDVLAGADVHSGVITLPAALSVGEARRASGRELLLAIVLGHEVLGKLGMAAQGWEASLPRRPTNIFGGYGPVTVAGRLMALDRKRMANALGYAAHLCMGIPEGSMMDHYYSFISHNGTLAVQLVEAGGVPFSNTTLEGELGLYRSFFGRVPEQLPKLIDELAYSELLYTVQKRYRGTAYNTTAIELFADLIDENRLGPGDVARVQVAIKSPGARERERHLTSKGPFARPDRAQSSLPYCLALVLLDGKIDIARFGDDDIVADEDIVQIMQQVDVVFERGAGRRWARLVVHTVDGRKIERESEFFTFPFPPEEWGAWLRASGAKLLPEANLGRLQQLIGTLEDVSDVSMLLEAATPPHEKR
jgi:2-methylcitrate dehydratase PrpD